VRALGETDLNPVSGLGKISQLFFAWIQPGNIVANIIAGGVAEAGAQQYVNSRFLLDSQTFIGNCQGGRSYARSKNWTLMSCLTPSAILWATHRILRLYSCHDNGIYLV
jgi:hypothetical protein